MRVAYELTPALKEQLYEFYFDEWWTQRRTREEADRGLAASYVTLLIDDAGVLVGFARAVSDAEFFAWVGDVIVRPGRRGEGIGAAIMEAMTAHPALTRVKKWDLSCLPELDGFYARFGFLAMSPSHTLRRVPEPPVVE